MLYNCPGLCKNDKHHDVRLCIDVLKYSTDSVKGRKVGQALFAIYPRPNQPRINLRAAQYEPLYNYHGVLALLRVGGDKLAMHCGRLAYNVCFREYQPPKHEDTPRESSSRPATFRTNVSQADTLMPISDQPTSNDQASQRLTDLQIITSESGTLRSSSNQPNTSKPSTPPITSYAGDQKHIYDTHDLKSSQMMEEQVRTPSPESDALQEQDEHSTGLDIPPSPSPLPQRSRKMEDNAPLILPSPPVTPSLTQRTRVLEQPPEQSTPQYGADLGFKLLSPSGTETVSVNLHAAAHLPSTAAGSVPSPFITLKSGTDEKNNVRAQSISHATQSPTHNPAWGETLTITIREEDAEHEDLLLTVADSPSQDALLTYRLPIKDLVPFHTYHLSMVQPHRLVSSGSHLYTSIVRRKSHFTQQRGFTYSALQVLLGGVEVPLQKPTRPLIAVARIVPDYTNNRYHSMCSGHNMCIVCITVGHV
ncbi:coiled-coil domain-containing protein 33-like [Bombina bombina]|uniref:coiled-coil domain-containing protein 33-like n=1 Tax=Bombina bombina TaxID=8345 RepID=UPI00235AF328|nr:coiled-coil domain-containing protein 33-like [Bombina bombina]